MSSFILAQWPLSEEKKKGPKIGYMFVYVYKLKILLQIQCNRNRLLVKHLIYKFN